MTGDRVVCGEAAGNRYACRRETAPRGNGSLLRPFAVPFAFARAPLTKGASIAESRSAQ